jgi:hypothetical protein
MIYVPRVVSYGHAKAIQLAAICLTFTTLVLVLHLYPSGRARPNIYEYTEGRTSEWHDWRNKTATTAPSDEVVYLKHLVDTYGLTTDVPWFARRIQTRFSSWSKHRPSIADVGAKFMSPNDFTRVRVDDGDLVLKVNKAVKVTANRSPRPSDVDASVLLFGVSTSYQRLVYRDHALLRDWQRWLTDGRGKANGAEIVVTLHQASMEEVAEVKGALQGFGIEGTVLASDETADAAGRYAELLYMLRRRNDALGEEGRAKDFLALVDDDVFFPSMAKLLERLRKFNPKKEYYLGAPSERSDWLVENNATLTYGGGAIFMTTSMAETASDLACLSSSDVDLSGDQWDMHLYNCVSQNTKIELQVLPSFYNPLEDELYGEQGVIHEGYSGGDQAFTLHHYRNFHRFEAGKGHLVTSICGEDCFLQRFRFKDNWILVNGYTITHYPEGVDALPLTKNSKLLKQQYHDAKATVVNERLVIHPQERSGDIKVVAWRGEKKTWRLLESSVRENKNGEVWQAYINKKGGGGSGELDDRLESDIVNSEEGRSDADSVIVLIWEP